MDGQRKTSGVRQRQIVDAAARVIVKYGSEHITIKTIAAETGISEGAIYRHFKSKRDILLLLVDHAEELLLQGLELSKWKAGKSDPLNSVMQTHVESIEKRNGFAFQLIAEVISLGDSALNIKALSVINKYIYNIENYLIEGQKNGLVKHDINTRMAATLFFHLIQGLISMWALNSYSFDIKTEFKQLWNIYSKGVLHHEFITDGNEQIKHRLCFS